MQADDRCQAGTCRQTWTRETPRGRRCELHANVAGPAPRPPVAYVRPDAAPLPSPPPPRPPPPPGPRQTPQRRDVVGMLSHNPIPAPGMCCALRDGEPCDRNAAPSHRGLCVGCRVLATRRGVLDDVARPPVPQALRGKRRPTLPVEEIVAAVAAGASQAQVLAEFGVRRTTGQRYWRRWTAQAAALRGCA